MSIHSFYFGEVRKEIMLRWPCREADTASWWWRCKGDAGSQMGLKTGKGKWRRLGKVLGEIILLVFVTHSDGMLWWRTSEKRAPIAWKQFCKALTEVCRTSFQQIACNVNTGGYSGSPAPLLPGGEGNSFFRTPSSHFTIHLCCYNAELVSCYPEGSRWCYWQHY